jgi:hypothetical protein
LIHLLFVCFGICGKQGRGRHDTQHNDIQHNDTQDKELVCDNQHKLRSALHRSYIILSINMLSVIILNVAMLSVILPSGVAPLEMIIE